MGSRENKASVCIDNSPFQLSQLKAPSPSPHPIAPPQNPNLFTLPSWEKYCLDYAGLSHQRLEGIIRNRSDIIAVSPETYRHIQPKVHDDCIEIAGEQVPILPDPGFGSASSQNPWVGRNNEPEFPGSPGGGMPTCK